MKISVSNHARRRILARMGSGFNIEKKAKEIWDANEQLDPTWGTPTFIGAHYRRFRQFVFVYKRHKWSRDMMLATVVGPFLDGATWDSQEL